MKKNNTWDIKRLVGGSIGQTNDRSIVLFHKLSDFKAMYTEKAAKSEKEFKIKCKISSFFPTTLSFTLPPRTSG